MPVKANERELFLDVIRGVAILGIFIANITSLSWYSENRKVTGPLLLPEWDHTIRYLQYVFIEGKFYSVFSVLFGWGIALQIKRATYTGIDPMPIVRRRLVFMLLFGAFHILIWPGDIVFLYALVGFILLMLLKFSNKALLVTACALILSPILLYWAKMNWPVLNYPSEMLFATGIKVDNAIHGYKTDEAYMEMMKNGNWMDQLKSNISGFFFRFSKLFFKSRVPKVLGLFLIGFVIGRSDFYKNLQQHKRLIYWVIGLGFLVGLPANYYMAFYMSNHAGDYLQLKTNGLYQTIWYALGVVPLALSYIGLLMLWYQNLLFRKKMAVFAPVGKMAFTNYILQSLVGNFIFLGAGLGYKGTVGPVYLTLFAVAIFLVQIVLSTVWLKHFNYGPIEWLWRSATYKKWWPFKKSGIINVG